MENFDFVEDLTDTINSTQTFATKLTLTKGVGLPSETYRIGFFAEIASVPGARDYEVQLINTTTSAVLAIEHKEQDEDDLRLTFTGFIYVALSGVDQTFAIQWRRETGSPADITIRNVRIEFWQATGLTGGGAVTSVFGRTGAVVAATSDYDASQIDNDSGVIGATVDAALDKLDSDIPDLTTGFQNIVTAIDNLTILVSGISGELQSAVAAISSLESNMDIDVSNQDLIDQYVELIIDVRRILKVMEIAQYGGKSTTG